MGTIRKEITKMGYCIVDKSTVPIPIEYNSFPQPNESRKNMTFIKNSNQCRYLIEGKCDLGKDCITFKNAETEIKLDVSNMNF